MLSDIRLLTEWTAQKYPGLPLIVFGHSMGSIFAQAALQAFGSLYACAILSGVTVDKPGRREIAPALAGAIGLLQGAQRPSKLLDSMAFRSNNKPFAPNRTAFDWLSRDNAEVDLYVADECCGFICTPKLYCDVASTLLETLNPRKVRTLPKGFPVLILSGSCDPVGNNGQAARVLEQSYRAAGLDVRMMIYEGARHELLNELNRDEVTEDILGFLDAHIKG